jgi:outer membrane protein
MKRKFLHLFIALLGVGLAGGATLGWAQEPMNTEVNLRNHSAETLPVGATESQPSEISGLKNEVVVNLNDCVQMAMLNNKEIQATDFDILAAKEKIKEAKPWSTPMIEYEFLTAPAPRNVDQAVESFFSGDVTLFQKGKIVVGWPVYTFGKLDIAGQLAEQGVSEKEERKTEKTNDVVLKVKTAYYGILLAKDLRKILQNAIDHLEKEITRRSEAEQGEESDPVDLVRLKLYRYEVQSRLSQLETKDYLAHHALRILLGLPRATEVDVAEQSLQPIQIKLKDFDYYLALAQKFRPENQLLKIALKAKELEYRLQKRDAAPNIGFGGIFEFGATTNSIQGLQLTDDFNDPFNYTRFGAGLRMDGKFHGKSYQAKTKEKQAEYFKVAMEKSVGEEGLELDLREAYVDVQQNSENMVNAHEAMQTARQFVFLTKSNMDVGLGDKKDYSDALQAYLLSQARYLEAIMKFNLAVGTLEQKVGGVATVSQPVETNQAETEPSDQGGVEEPNSGEEK